VFNCEIIYVCVCVCIYIYIYIYSIEDFKLVNIQISSILLHSLNGEHHCSGGWWEAASIYRVQDLISTMKVKAMHLFKKLLITYQAELCYNTQNCLAIEE